MLKEKINQNNTQFRISQKTTQFHGYFQYEMQSFQLLFVELPIIVRQSDSGSLNANSYFISRKAHGQKCNPVLTWKLEPTHGPRIGGSQALGSLWAPCQPQASALESHSVQERRVGVFLGTQLMYKLKCRIDFFLRLVRQCLSFINKSKMDKSKLCQLRDHFFTGDMKYKNIKQSHNKRQQYIIECKINDTLWWY